MATCNFFRRGGIDQLRIETPEDLAAIETLDQKLWIALSMPVFGQEFDEKTLKLLDADGDGRIRAPEIIAAVKFVRANLKDFTSVFAGKDAVPLAAIADGSALAGTAENILERLGKRGNAEISLADVENATAAFDAQPFNGDGVLVPASAGDDAEISAFIADAIAATGGSDDASGAKGISAAQAEAFVKSAADVLAWRAKAENSPEILPFGAETAAAFDALAAVRAKIEDFFARTRLASFDAAAAAKLNPDAADFDALSKTQISAAASEAFPLARIAATDSEPTLPLASGINPAWVGALKNFAAKTLAPALGKLGVPAGTSAAGNPPPSQISASRWNEVCALLAPYEAWLGAKPAGGADAFPSERLSAVVAGNFPEKLAPLFARDAGEAPLRAAFADAERLCRSSRDLVFILRNFVSFAEFYKRSAGTTAFLVGTLFMDCRSCALCVRVADAGAHAALAAKSNCCLAYCECARKNGGEKMTVVAMFGDGDSRSLYIGRNGVFYDKKGEDWDAKIVKLIENPISIRQAFWTPYRKVAKFVETQIESFASAREKKVDSELSSGAGTALTKATGGDAAAGTQKTSFDVAKFAGIFAAIGLALGAIGAALSVAITGFLSLAAWQMVLVVVAVLAVISAPSMLIAAMKLRSRSLGPILEANGWAINGNVRINIPLGKAFTEMPKKPKGAKMSAADPYKQRGFPWKRCLAALVVLALAAFAAWHFYFEPKCEAQKAAAEAAAAQATENTQAVPADAPAERAENAPAAVPADAPVAAPESAPAA